MLDARERECTTVLQRDLDMAMEFLGQTTRDKLLFILTDKFHISLAGEKCSTLEDIEAALRELVGEGASIIMAKLNKQSEHEDAKNCKVCDKEIDIASTSKESVLADLCDDCGKLLENLQWEIL